MKIEIPVHTILFTVAPSNSGKSYFCNNVLIKQLKDKYSDLNIQYISSDEIRREILNDPDRLKHDIEMLQASTQAFNLLSLKLDVATSFPISSEVIIVDTTGLSEQFRDELITHAKKTNYNIIPILFDYDNREDFFLYKEDTTDGSVIAKHVTKFRKEVLKTIKKSKYTDVIKIRKKDFNDIEVSLTNYDFYRSHFINGIVDYIIVSDIHGCLDEFKEIIRKNDCVIDDGKIIRGNKVFIVQDYIDKGYDIEGTINFIYDNFKLGSVLPLIGNHENYVYKRLKGSINKNFELETEYFNSVEILQNDEELKNKFFELFEASKHFYRHKNFFCNHAPCPEKYLGKIDSYSLKSQRNFVYAKSKDFDNETDYIKKVEENLSFIKDYKSFNSKPVIWGHIALKNTFKYANIHMIDTGAVSGNKLTSISINKYGSAFFKHVSTKDNAEVKDTSDSLISIFQKDKYAADININSLEPDDLKRINYLIRNKINYISGTMCPADKNIEDNELESLKEGLLYYKNAGIDKVILQKKYMGSRAQILLVNKECLKDDSITNKTISRNGYIIDNRIDMSSIYENLYGKFQEWMEENDVKAILFDLELLPWSALGKGLINKDFIPVEVGTQTEYQLLMENGFWDEISKFNNDPKLEEFKVDVTTLKKQECIEKYTQNVYRTFNNLLDYLPEHIDSAEYEKGMNIYQRQLELFGKDGELDVKLFSVLKLIKKDNSEKLFFDESNIEIFKFVSNDDYCVVDFSDEDYFKKANQFYEEITKNQELEGIVIKPEKVYNKYVAPYIKCRNKNYLTITYGFDYLKDNKYNKLFKKKNIRKKLKASIDEFEIGKRMLEVPYNEINKENKELINVYAKMILDEKVVQTLDPRL